MANKDQKKEKRYVKFSVSPTGAFGLGYNAGDVGYLDGEQADEIVTSFYGQYCDEDGNLSDGGKSTGKKDTGDIKALTAKAVGFGIDVPATATAEQVQTLIDNSHTEALKELKTLRGATVKTNDGAKESAAAGAKESKPENAADKAAGTSEKA